MIERLKEEVNEGKLESRIKSLEADVALYREELQTKKSMYSFVKSSILRFFCRQNLELVLSVSALAISIATAIYMLKI